MKCRVSKFVGLFFLLLALVPVPWTVRAQIPGNAGATGFIQLFGGATSFTARGEALVQDGTHKELFRTPLEISRLDSRIRVEIDMGQMKGANVTPQSIAQLKQAGLDRLVSVTRLDQKAAYQIFPSLRSYVRSPLSEAEAGAKGLQVLKSPLGKETIDGRACVKNKTVVKNAQGVILFEGITWNAAELKDFPVQIGVEEKGHATFLRFKQIQMASPNPALFDPPAGFKRYENSRDLTVRTIGTSKAPANAKPTPTTGATPGRAAPATKNSSTATSAAAARSTPAVKSAAPAAGASTPKTNLPPTKTSLPQATPRK